MDGWKQGQIVDERTLRRLSRWLSRNGVVILQNEWAAEILRTTGHSAEFVRFRDGSAAILLLPDATRYQLIHELKHYEHWLWDPVQYGNLNRLVREEFVFKAINDSHHWKRFSESERQHATDQIQYFRNLYGESL